MNARLTSEIIDVTLAQTYLDLFNATVEMVIITPSLLILVLVSKNIQKH